MRRHSLESRLSILVAGLLFALLFAVGHVQMTSQKALLEEEKADKYEMVSNLLALAYQPISHGDNTSNYREFTAKLLDKSQDISYIAIKDAKQRVLFADSREQLPYKVGESNAKNINERIFSLIKSTTSSDRPITEINVPAKLNSGEHGIVTVGFLPDTMENMTEDMRTRLLCTFALALLLGIIGAILLARAIVHPVQELIKAVRRAGSGDLNVTVSATSDDEIGELGQAFNTMITELRDNHNKLVERANTDSLTDLYNHRYFQERLSSELSRAERYNHFLSIVMLDIDNFKTLNDTHGHPIGDVVLKEVAKCLLSEARDIDIVTRYGGEEFTLVLPETAISEAVTVAERLRTTIQRHRFMGKNGEIIPVTVSLGVAQYPIHSSEREGLIMAADLAMYQAKTLGRNRTVSFTNDVRTSKDSDPYKLYLLLHATDIGTIEAISAAIDAKGRRSPGFSKAVMTHSVTLAKTLGMSKDEQNDVRMASLLHDVGKLGISEEILNKRGDLTEEEQSIIRSHPALGYAIVQKSPRLQPMLPGILHHHEYWDGSGYPNGLTGEEIPMIARIIAIVDAYHAMLAKKPYKKPKTPQEAIDELRRCSGAQFDGNVVEAFARIVEKEIKQEIAA